jgi:uncharacterized membrane protein
MISGALLLAVHVLGAIVWVGGMFFALVVLRPSMAVLESGPGLALHEQVFRRFFLVVWHVMPVMLLTGLAMEYLFYGFANVPWPVQAMAGTGVAMAAVFVAIVAGPWRALRRALASGEMAQTGAAMLRLRRLITVNLVLGVVTAVLAVLDA